MSENLEAEFLARVTTGTTHEIRNVLAIINETAGLLEDMIRAAEEGRSFAPERLMRSIARIGAQVDRGAELMTALNRLAHGIDKEIVTVDLYQEAAQVALMCGRVARQNGHQVRAVSSDHTLSVKANRLLVDRALFTAAECCMQQLPGPGTVVMHTGRSGGALGVAFVCDSGEGAAMRSPVAAASWGRLVETLDRLDARVETEDDSCFFRVVFSSGDAV